MRWRPMFRSKSLRNHRNRFIYIICQSRNIATSCGCLNVDGNNVGTVPKRPALDWSSDVDYSREKLFQVERHWHTTVRDTPRPPPPKSPRTPTSYILSMFPYPSGTLHMGHVRVYTISDVFARRARQGEGGAGGVLHPMGWDAFGLPAENAARDRGLGADEWTRRNIETMRQQIVQLGCDFDWNCELSTCDPAYFKWTQWLFCKLFESSLLYKRMSFVNWDPIDKTVLADEQIDDDGKSWRSGAKAEKKRLKQWFVSTSRFAEALYNGLQHLPHWPDQVRAIQRHWIGSPDYYAIHLPLARCQSEVMSNSNGDTLEVRLRDMDSLLLAEFVAIKSTHLCAVDAVKGVKHSPIGWVRVPHLGAVLPVIVSDDEKFETDLDVRLGGPKLYSDDAGLLSHFSTGNKINENIDGRALLLHAQPSVVDVDELPVEHSQLENQTMIPCSSCGTKSPLDGDTLDTFFDSSWYFVRYLDARNDVELCSREAAGHLPVDVYVGGLEHAALHLYYARFMTHFMYQLGIVPTREPFVRLVPQGIVKGRTFCTETGRYLPQDRVLKSKNGGYIAKETGEIVEESWSKMSKSKFNGVDPSVILDIP